MDEINAIEDSSVYSLLENWGTGDPVIPNLFIIMPDPAFFSWIIDVGCHIEQMGRAADTLAAMGHTGRYAQNLRRLVITHEQLHNLAMAGGVWASVAQSNL